MKQISTNLAGLLSPWNCPHGRPTMIKLPKIKINENLRIRNIYPIDFEK